MISRSSHSDFERPAYARPKPLPEEIAAGPLSTYEQVHRMYETEFARTRSSWLGRLLRSDSRKINRLTKRAIRHDSSNGPIAATGDSGNEAARKISFLLASNSSVPPAIASGKKTVNELYDETGALTTDGRIAVGYTILRLSTKNYRKEYLAETVLDSLNENRVESVQLAHDMADLENVIRSDTPTAVDYLGHYFAGKDKEKFENIIKYSIGREAVKAADYLQQLRQP